MPCLCSLPSAVDLTRVCAALHFTAFSHFCRAWWLLAERIPFVPQETRWEEAAVACCHFAAALWICHFLWSWMVWEEVVPSYISLLLFLKRKPWRNRGLLQEFGALMKYTKIQKDSERFLFRRCSLKWTWSAHGCNRDQSRQQLWGSVVGTRL